MDYTSLLAEVYTLTKRPDLAAETALAVKSATLQLHRSDYYSKDLFESGIAFTTSDYLQTLDYRTLLPNWRALKYLRKYDAVNLTAGLELTVIPIEKVLDGYALERTDVLYLAGNTIQIKSSTQEQYYLLGAYVNPSIDPTTYNSWIAAEFPYAIVFTAASIVMKIIHQDEVAATFLQEAQIEASEMMKSNIEVVGS